MKKFFGIFVVAIAFFAATAQAQNGMPAISKTVFSKGDNIVSLTVGYGWGFSQRLVYEHAVASWFDGQLSVGVGAAVGNSIKFWYDGDISDRLYVGAVASCHYQFIDKLDTYVQLGLGLMTRFGYRHYYQSVCAFDATGSAGVRWYFNDNFAVNAEVGYTTDSYFMAGVTYKF